MVWQGSAGNRRPYADQCVLSSDRTQGGLGIGLTMARTLVEMHGGTIAAQSDGPGMGSEFVITLPLAAGEPTPRATGCNDRSARSHSGSSWWTTTSTRPR